MARVTLAPGLQGISGKVGNLVFRTYQNGHVHVHKANDYLTPRRRASPGELANRRRFGIVSSITARIQSGYEWADQAAHDRRNLRKRVQYHYDKLLARSPHLTDAELTNMILHHFSSTLSGQSKGEKPKKRG